MREMKVKGQKDIVNVTRNIGVSAKSDWSLMCDYSAFSALILILLAAMVMHGTEAPVNDLMFVKQLNSGPLSKATFFRSFHTKIATALSQRSLG